MNKYKQFSKSDKLPKDNRSVVTCKSKQRFETLEYAEGIAKKQEEKCGIKIYVYSCSFCSGYHITKNPPLINN
jgi:hypothetical protein